MKKLIYILAFLLIASFANATDWYCQNSSSNINAANNWNDNPVGGGNVLTWGNQAAGDNFYANGKTAIEINANPGPNGTVTLRNDAGAGTVGGQFTYATANNLTMTMNVTAGATDCLLVTGSTGGGSFTGTFTGGTGTGIDAVYDTHTVVDITIAGALVGGTGSTASGYRYNPAGAASGSITVSATVTGGAMGPGLSFTSTGGGTATISGLVKGGTSYVGPGVQNLNTTAVTITGNIDHSSAGPAIEGNYIYSPASAQNWIKMGTSSSLYVSAGLGSDAGGTQITAANTAAKVASGTYFVKKDDGVYTQGTSSGGGGGGAWAQ